MKYETSNAKFILIGEHAVLYGAKALALPLKNFRLKCYTDSISNLDFSLIKKTLEIMKITSTKVPIISVDSDISQGVGLGSSAALTVCLVKLFFKIFNLSIKKNDIYNIFNKLESYFHTVSSGLDTSVIFKNKPIIYQKLNFDKKKIDDLVIKQDLPFILIDSKSSSKTKNMILKSKKYFNDNNLYKFDQLSDNMIYEINFNNLKNIGQIINNCHNYLKEIGLSNDNIENIICRNKSIGVLGSKITGSGGGGYVLSLLNPIYYQKQIDKLTEFYGKDRLILPQIK